MFLKVHLDKEVVPSQLVCLYSLKCVEILSETDIGLLSDTWLTVANDIQLKTDYQGMLSEARETFGESMQLCE